MSERENLRLSSFVLVVGLLHLLRRSQIHLLGVRRQL